MSTLTKNGRYAAPLHEKPEEDLLYAIRRDYLDAEECRAELHRRGWLDRHIDSMTGTSKAE